MGLLVMGWAANDRVGRRRRAVHEFIMQPLRQEQLRRGNIIPIQGYKALRGKLQFINSLQPFFASGEISFAKDVPAIITIFVLPDRQDRLSQRVGLRVETLARRDLRKLFHA